MYWKNTHVEDADLIETIRFLCMDILAVPNSSETLRTITARLGRDYIFIRPPGILRRGYNRFIRKRKTDLYSFILKRILKVRGVVREMLGVSNERGETKFILRVDDFPRWDIPSREYMRFHEILRENNIPYLLGVTPSISLAPLNPQSMEYRSLMDEEIVILKEISTEGVEIALHGFTHKTRTRKKPHSELIGLSEEGLKENIQNGLNRLKGIATPYFFIPPFNTVDLRGYQVLAKYFRGISTGREIIPFLGFRITPSYLFGTLYIPSYEPCYGYAKDIFSYIKTINDIDERVIIPITLHWAWEIKDSFEWVRRLARLIMGRTIPWGDLLRG